MKRIITLLALGVLCLSAAAQTTLRDITITAKRNGDYSGAVRLEAKMVHTGDMYVGKIKTRIYNRFEEYDNHIVNRLVAEDINYEQFRDGASLIQTFKINIIPEADTPFIAKTTIYDKDGTETVIETPFSFGALNANAEIPSMKQPEPAQSPAVQ